MKIQPVQQLEKTVYLAGGCFWGVEAYFQEITGILETTVGYANGHVKNPSYEDVCMADTGHAETVKVLFDEAMISFEEVLLHFFRIINPYTLNQQGNDIGPQYRSGIYVSQIEDIGRVVKLIRTIDKDRRFVVEVKLIETFYEAEEYHQDYLKKNPSGYCHINRNEAKKSLVKSDYQSFETEDEVAKRIGHTAYKITKESATEAPFSGVYDTHFEKGIYVDVISGKPLFLSSDKYDSGCGWPAFTRPITADVIDYKRDLSLGRERVEVRSDTSHLGHVFTDGPLVSGGLRYCINSAAIRFVSIESMEDEGYGYLIPLVK